MNHRRPTTLEPISAAVFVMISLHVATIFIVWWWWQNQNDTGSSQPLVWMAPSDFKTTLAPAIAAVKTQSVAAASPAKASKRAPTAPPKKVEKAEEPVQKATLVAAPPQQHQMEPVLNETSTPLFASSNPAPKPSANRSITLRRAPEKSTLPKAFGSPAPPMASPTLLDIVRLNAMRQPPPVIPPPAPNTQAAKEEINLDAVDEAVNAAFLATWTAPPIDVVPPAQREARLNLSVGKDGTVLKAQMSKFSGSHALDQSILEAAAQVKKISTTLPSNFTKDSYDLELNFLLLP